MELESNHHSVFLLHYHLVLVVKYRRKVFDDIVSAGKYLPGTAIMGKSG